MTSPAGRDSAALNRKLVGLIEQEGRQIRIAWHKMLRDRWGKAGGPKLSILTRADKKDKDLLSFLAKGLTIESQPGREYLHGFLNRVRTQKYSISDFFLEVSCLQSAIDEALGRSKQLPQDKLLSTSMLVRRVLSNIFETVLTKTSEIYEYITETGGRGFCQVGPDGTVLYANSEMNRILGHRSCVGKSLESFFDGEEKDFVRDALSGSLGTQPRIRELNVMTKNNHIPVVAEIAPVIIGGHNRGGYAGILDHSSYAEKQMTILDSSPFGIVKINVGGEFTYANPKALEILGTDSIRGKTVRDVVPDDDNFAILARQMEDRFKGISDQYEIEITRLDDHRRIPVMVSAMPQTDLNGNVVGSEAHMRSLVLEKTIEAMHKHIETIQEGKAILQAVANEILRVLPFDLFATGVNSSDMKHTRAMLTYSPGESIPWSKRWWEVPPQIADWVNQHEPFPVGDLQAFLDDPKWQYLKGEPDIEKLLKGGFRSFIRYPIIREGRVAAYITLMSKRQNAFSEDDVKVLKQLPLPKAVLMALSYDEREDLTFRLNLIKEISSAFNNLQQIAEVLVHRLAKHYDWQNIALFRVDEARGVIRLACEEAAPDTSRFPGAYEQPINKGVLGHVYRTKEDVNIGNARTDQQFKDIFVRGIRDSVSELCLPIVIDGKVTWILNVEDPRTNAFSEDEKNDLRLVLDEVSAFLDRSWLHHFVKATLESASDAVIIVDTNGVVRKINPAVTKMLGYPKEEMLDTPLNQYFRDPQIAAAIVDGQTAPTQEVELKHEDGREVSILMSSSQLPEEFGGMVLIAADLSLHKRIEQLEYLGRMYYELATQTKTPLSLVFSWLRNAKAKDTTRSLGESIDKAMRQLRKVQLTYDRLALYDPEETSVPYNAVLLHISEVLSRIIEDFPKDEAEKIEIQYEGEIPYVRGDLFQLSFCLETMISYLLRFVPEEKRINIRVSHGTEWLSVEIDGWFPGVDSQIDETHQRGSSPWETLTEMALGEKMIAMFMKNHGGEFHKPRRAGQRIEFRIDLPLTTLESQT